MIILELYLLGWFDGFGCVVAAADETAAGYAIRIPKTEWEALGKPQTMQFVLSAEKLSVGKGNVVRERP